MKNVVTDWEIQTVAHQLFAATVLQESALIHCTSTIRSRLDALLHYFGALTIDVFLSERERD